MQAGAEVVKIQMRKRLLSEEAWNRGIAALLAFIEREGHCAVPRHHRERGYRLGQWVAVQRYNEANLDGWRKAQLNQIGFIWSQRDQWWDEGFAALKAFKACEGHCHVRADHVEGKVHLGHWVTVQRRERDKMNPYRKHRLDKIGFVWKGINAAQKRKITASQSKRHSRGGDRAAAIT